MNRKLQAYIRVCSPPDGACDIMGYSWCSEHQELKCVNCKSCQSQWPCGLRRKSAAARLMRSWVRIPPGAWMSVCCECCVLSGRGLCDELITRPEESYRLWCVVECDLETSLMRRPWPALGRSATGDKKNCKSYEVCNYETLNVCVSCLGTSLWALRGAGCQDALSVHWDDNWHSDLQINPSNWPT